MTAPRQIVTVVDTYPCLSETFIDREVGELRRQGVEVEVDALRGDAEHRLASRAAGELRRTILRQYLTQPRRCLSLLRRAGQAAGLAERLRTRPDACVLAQFAWTTADVARMAGLLTGSPFFVRVHAWDVFAQAPAALRQRLDTARIVLPCSGAAAAAVTACGFPAEQTIVVRHGLPLDDPAWDWRPPGTSCRIVGIGRLVPKKGVGVLLDACATLAREGVAFALEWIGDGPEAASLMRKAAALGLANRVHFVGALSPAETRGRLRGADLFVLPSRRLADGDRDGIANVIVEAMALGVPVVTTTASAAREVLVHGESALLVEPDDPVALAAAVRQGLDPAKDRENMSRAARGVAEREFDLARNVRALAAALTR